MLLQRQASEDKTMTSPSACAAFKKEVSIRGHTSSNEVSRLSLRY